MKTNVLYYGDNLDILRHHIPDESIDLIYLDPPFNSQATYNVLFREESGAVSHAQIEAFEDTWHWGETTARAYDEVIRGPHQQVARMLGAMVDGLGHNQVTAYLTMMAIRLIELHRVLKSTGSIYLHCDPTASHYLKLLLDSIFGPERFTDEIVWKRTSTKGHSYTRFPSNHDIILLYRKADGAVWNPQFEVYQESYVASHYTKVEPGTGRRYGLWDCTNPNSNRPNLTYDWNGHLKVWRWTKEKMQALHDQGRLEYTRTGVPRYKRYLDEGAGVPIGDTWNDIFPVNSQAKERLGYPTQKPVDRH